MPSEFALAQALSSNHLELIILPTEHCNFRCTYCYEDFSIGRMKPKIVLALKKLIAYRISKLRSFTLSWFGGEPLVAKDIVLDIGRWAHDLCLQRGASFFAGLTTNAYLLTPELFCRLLDIRHTDYQITLDGEQDWHDRTRLLANGNGTFSTIWGHLNAYRREEREFSMTLRLHVHNDNVESMKRLYERLKNDLLPDTRFKPYFHKISNLSGKKIPHHVLNDTEYSSALKYITGATNLMDEVSAESTLKNYICYAARPNSLMVRADGRLGKCTVALNDPRNDIGRLADDGALDIDQEKLRVWFEGYRDMSDELLSCPLSALGKAYARANSLRDKTNEAASTIL